MDASVNRITASKDEKALLIGIRLGNQKNEEVDYSLEELKLLVLTAGAVIEDSLIIKRDAIDASHIIGKGQVENIRDMVEEKGLKLIVFDLINIRPAQIKNLEEVLNCRVIGRNEVILDIFARRAKSAEAQIQVELAQLKYMLPRLRGLGTSLSKLGGGIGTRGPGEKLLETDRRHIVRRINTLGKKLKKQEKHRALTRRSRSSEFLGAVVGYTNAGKSTLLNQLAKDDLFVENRLFATLDSYTRSVFLGPGEKTLITDTVGFIRNLPANLIESFRSTLEDIANSDYILHVVDINSFDIDTNVKTVEHELAQLDIEEKPVIMFFNKSDLADEALINRIKTMFPSALIGSAKAKHGIDELKESIIQLRRNPQKNNNNISEYDDSLYEFPDKTDFYH